MEHRGAYSFWAIYRIGREWLVDGSCADGTWGDVKDARQFTNAEEAFVVLDPSGYIPAFAVKVEFSWETTQVVAGLKIETLEELRARTKAPAEKAPAEKAEKKAMKK